MESNITPYCYSKFGIPNKFGPFTKEVSIFIDGIDFNALESKNTTFKVLIQGCEPPEITGNAFIDNVCKYQNNFNLILATHPKILSLCSNSKLYPFGTTWISSNDYYSVSEYNKNFEITYLCGTKKFLIGHKFRHDIFQKLQNIKKFMTIPINSKFEYLFKNSQFSIIIENTQNVNYFTEKIVDCLITKTIPLYWGCPNINDFFDINGIFQFNNISELVDIITKIDKDTYIKKIPFIISNYNKAIKYDGYWNNINKEIEKLL